MLDHGGNLAAAIAEFGGDAAHWIDLSTGINPNAYPVGKISAHAWTRLPERARLVDLEHVAQRAYNTKLEVIAVAGAQAAIQLIPGIAAAGTATVLTPTYNEHAGALRAAGWTVREADTLKALEGSSLAVVVNPNNPDGATYRPEQLCALAETVEMLVVDESFADPVPALSLTNQAHALAENIILLRSFGKFYGLAGVRLGFVLCAPAMARRFRDMIGPWPVSGMAIEVAERALADKAWAQKTTAQLHRDAERLDLLAKDTGWDLVGGTPLFRTFAAPDAGAAQRQLAAHHIWTRIFPYSKNWIRLGMPGTDAEWSRLAAALTHR
jgi:cobalamin biosynthesis protein CobC